MPDLPPQPHRHSPVLKWKWAFAIATSMAVMMAVLFGQLAAKNLGLQRRNQALELQLSPSKTTDLNQPIFKQSDTDLLQIALTPRLEKPRSTVQVLYSRKAEQLFLLATAVPASGPGKLYQVWLVPESSSAIPVAVFKPDHRGSAAKVVSQVRAVRNIQEFFVTEESEQATASVPASAPLFRGEVEE